MINNTSPSSTAETITEIAHHTISMAPIKASARLHQPHSHTQDRSTATAVGSRSSPRIMRHDTMQDLSTFEGPNRGGATYIHHPREASVSSSEEQRLERDLNPYSTAHLNQLMASDRKASRTSASVDRCTPRPRSEVSKAHETRSHQPNQLRSSKIGYNDLNAHYVAAERQRQEDLIAAAEDHNRHMSSLMTAKLLAEAESQELYARILRENVNRIDQYYDGDKTLRLTAAPELLNAPQDYDETFELEADYRSLGTSTYSIASGDTINEKVQLPQLQHGSAEQPDAQDRAWASNDEEPVEVILKPKAQWQPQAIARLTTLPITASNTETFTWEQLHRHLGGAQYSPSLYFSRNTSKFRLLQGRTYWLLEGAYEPFAPTTPGQHGAKLTAFFNDSLTADGDVLDEEDYHNVPLFVCLQEGEGYTYLGQYSQKRYSDKLSHSELFQQVPRHVLKYWAAQLADPARPAWITEKLIAHFWPAPPYTGPIPSDSAITTPGTGVTSPRDPEQALEKRVQRALERYALKLRDWKKDTDIKATLLNEQALMEMWDKSDMDEEKGLRLWWEYLECVGFDEEFYGKLVDLKGQKKKGVARTTSVSKTVAKIEQGVLLDGQKQFPPPARRDSEKKRERHDSVSTLYALQDDTTTNEASVQHGEKPMEPLMPKAPLKWSSFPQADLQAAREMQDSATKARDRKRGRSEKPVKW